VREQNPEGVAARVRRRVRRRRQFWVKGPNRVWSVDGHDKLSRFGFEIYAAIDAYSRYIIWCFVGHSNRTAVSVNKQFLLTAKRTRTIPKLIRSDMGTETSLLCNSQLILRRQLKPGLEFRKAYSFGKSTKNQRIESWWNLLGNAQTDPYRELFQALENEGYFDGGDIDILCLQFIYMDMIREHIHSFVEVHNHHQIRHQANRAHYLPTGQPHQLYHHPKDGVRDYGNTPDEAMVEALLLQLEAYDVDEYLVPETRQLCCQLLEREGFQTQFRWADNHIQAYIYLRQALFQYILEGHEILILEKPVGAEDWIRENAEEIQREAGLQRQRPVEDQDFILEETDNEQEVAVEERWIQEYDDGNWEYEDGEGNQDVEIEEDDDGQVLYL
jgi:hypothetical protein